MLLCPFTSFSRLVFQIKHISLLHFSVFVFSFKILAFWSSFIVAKQHYITSLPSSLEFVFLFDSKLYFRQHFRFFDAHHRHHHHSIIISVITIITRFCIYVGLKIIFHVETSSSSSSSRSSLYCKLSPSPSPSPSPGWGNPCNRVYHCPTRFQICWCSDSSSRSSLHCKLSSSSLTSPSSPDFVFVFD